MKKTNLSLLAKIIGLLLVTIAVSSYSRTFLRERHIKNNYRKVINEVAQLHQKKHVEDASISFEYDAYYSITPEISQLTVKLKTHPDQLVFDQLADHFYANESGPRLISYADQQEIHKRSYQIDEKGVPKRDSLQVTHLSLFALSEFSPHIPKITSINELVDTYDQFLATLERTLPRTIFIHDNSLTLVTHGPATKHLAELKDDEFHLIGQIDPQQKLNSPQIDTLMRTFFQQIKSDQTFSPLARLHLQPTQVWWINEENWNIIVPKGQSLVIRTNVPPTSQPPVPVKTKQSQHFHQLVAEFMAEHGLVLDRRNSSISTQDQAFVNYIQAYQGQGLLCTAATDEGVMLDVITGGGLYSIELSLNCTTEEQLQATYQQYLPFLEVVGTKGRNGVALNHLVFNDKVAQVSVYPRITGAKAHLYKQNNNWQIISIGQESPLCSELEEKHLPREYWISCYDDNGHELPGSPLWNELIEH
jgi:hypothetical protein